MTVHYLLSSKSKTKSLKDIFHLSDEEAFDIFKQIRWADNNGEPVCPHCSSSNPHYFLKKYKRWTCSSCRKQFSVTSGTIFANRKLPLKDYLTAILLFTNGAKGISALQISRDLGVKYETAFNILHKLRESIFNKIDPTLLEGEVEIDGAYVNHYVRPHNKKDERIDRRTFENQNPNKRCVMVMRQRDFEKGKGAKRTYAFLITEENQKDILRETQNRVALDSVIYADEHPSYNILHKRYEVKRINHKKEYKSEEACTNQAESYFSRLRRAHIGQYHRMSLNYLPFYIAEMAYREDTRRTSNGEIFNDLLSKSLNSPQRIKL